MPHDSIQSDRRHPDRAFSRAPEYAPPELIDTISARLRGVCAHLPREDFAALVRRVAHIQWKYDRREHTDSFGGGVPDGFG